MEIRKDGEGLEGEIMIELRQMKGEIEELKKKVGWMEPFVKKL